MTHNLLLELGNKLFREILTCDFAKWVELKQSLKPIDGVSDTVVALSRQNRNHKPFLLRFDNLLQFKMQFIQKSEKLIVVIKIVLSAYSVLS